jgi:predicted acylesterase/phospholipase RssA
MAGNFFVDGGVVMNTPIKPASRAGATELHVVSLDPSIPDLPCAYAENSWDVFSRVYTAMVASKIAADVESAKLINEGVEVLERAAANKEFDGADAQRL